MFQYYKDLKFSINFAKREAASSGTISPFPPIISVETKPG